MAAQTVRDSIDPTQLGQFTEDGKLTLSRIGLDFACKNCHVEGGSAITLTDKKLMEKAYNYYSRPASL
ncbi:MAG: hypothetical protein ACYSWW_21130 [Planctomycetota bacterium]|jgi:hypothetical protein